MREVLFAVLLLVAGGFIVMGAATASTALAWAVAGVLLAAWSWLVLSE